MRISVGRGMGRGIGRGIGRGVVRTVAAVAGTLALAAGLSACAASSAGSGQPERHSFDPQGQTVTIDSDDSALELVPTTADRVTVTRWFDARVLWGPKPSASWDWTASEDRLRLRVHCTGVVTHCSVRHRIEVPKDVRLVVHNGDGRVQANDFTQPVTITSQDGKVTAERDAGALTITTRDGAVRATDLTARRVTISSHDAKVHLGLRTVPDQVDVTTADGSTTISAPGSARYRIAAHTADGSTRVTLPRDARSSHRIAARATDGSITIRPGGA